MEKDDKIYDTIKQRGADFRSLSARIHVVLNVDQRLFDLLLNTKEIRPYNSGKWYEITGCDYNSILEFIYNIVKEIEEDEDTAVKTYASIGTYVDNILLLDLVSMDSEIFSIGYYENEEINAESKILHENCKSLMTKLQELYDLWDNVNSNVDYKF